MKRLWISSALAGACVLVFAPGASAQDMGHAQHEPAKPMSMGLPMAPAPAVYAGQADKAGAPVFDNLGKHVHPISTRNPETQKLFNQGINLLFGFNHAEAVRSFREAARLDPDCAMCWWGVAYALGPNINLPMQPDAAAPAWQALGRARALAPKASAAERAWIEALAKRYSEDPKADRKPLDAAFAQAMGEVARSQPDDIDAQVFHVEAMMDTQPWDYWEADARTPKGNGAAIVSTLERVLARSPDHPGALHLYIHAVEASTTPERAEPAADRLVGLMPASGHIVHMPSHIFYRVGRYADAAKANELAAQVDEAYIAACKAQGFYPAGYYGHNIHFLWTASESEGRYQAAMDAARRLVKSVDAVELAKTLSVAELYVLTPVATMVRFGKWKDLLAEPAPPEALKLDTAIWRYGQAFALANTGDRRGARRQRDALAALGKTDLTVFDPFAIPARPIIELAVTLVDGEIARTSGDLPKAVSLFQQARQMELALPYYEPAYWHRPTSHLLGAALLEAKRPAEAEAVYRDSLVHYRRDGWALFGLVQALEAQGKATEAAEVRRAFQEAWRRADVQLASSRF